MNCSRTRRTVDLALAYALLTMGLAGSSFAEAPTNVRCLETEAYIRVMVGEKAVLQYNKAVRESPEGIEPLYRRSGYIHPIFSPDGTEVTGDFPADHPHQHALFFAWTRSRFQDRQIDFWNQKAKTGRISHDQVLSLADGNRFGEFVVKLLHEDVSQQQPQPVLSEIWKVRVHNQSDYFVFDIQSEQQCVSESPLILEKYHYGGMAFRGSDQWYSNDAAKQFSAWERQRKQDPSLPPPGLDVMRHSYLTSEGRQRHDGNHTRPRWVDIFGMIDGKMTGIAILGHADNFRAPQTVRLHPSKPYFCFAPMATGAFQIKPGETYVSKYRYIVHQGKPDTAVIDSQWKRFTR